MAFATLTRVQNSRKRISKKLTDMINKKSKSMICLDSVSDGKKDKIIKQCEMDGEEPSVKLVVKSASEYSPRSSPLGQLSKNHLGHESDSVRELAPKGRIPIGRLVRSDLRQDIPGSRLDKFFYGAAQIGSLPPQFVPVVDQNNTPLMPTKLARAIRWLKTKKATFFYVRGIFCVRLNQEPSARYYQEIVLAIDPGSKKEGYTLKSKAHTYLNIQADAVTWVGDAIKTRREMRRGRRSRNTPYRKCRSNRKKRSGWMPPSTFARWNWKLRIINVLRRMFRITNYVVEDIAAVAKKGKRKWNVSFSPLEQGKHWFYEQLRKLGKLETRQGYETKALRDKLGLKKSKKKLEESFAAHCVDSWVLAWDVMGGRPTLDNTSVSLAPTGLRPDSTSDKLVGPGFRLDNTNQGFVRTGLRPDNTDVIYISPIRLHRRQLYALCPGKGGIRRPYGGTRSLGLKRGSLVRHKKKYGLCYVGGTSKNRISVHSVETGERLARNVKVEDCQVLTWNTWRIWANSSPPTRRGVPLAFS